MLVSGEVLVSVGFVLIVIGVFLVFIGMVSGALSGGGSGESESGFGGVIIIGPIPIVFGSSSKMAVLAAVLGIVLLVLSILLYYMMGRPLH